MPLLRTIGLQITTLSLKLEPQTELGVAIRDSMPVEGAIMEVKSAVRRLEFKASKMCTALRRILANLLGARNLCQTPTRTKIQ